MKRSELIENSNRYRRLKRGLFGDPSGKIKTFAIISAENPLGWKDSTEEEFKQRFVQWFDDKKLYNKQSVEKIKSSVLLHKIEENGNTGLRYGGFTYVPLKGKYEVLEKSYIIFNLTLSDAKTIARDYGQESFFFANVGEDKSTITYYQTFNGCKTYKLVDVSETISDETDAQDYFSKFGFKFRINMREFGDEIPEVTDRTAFEESFDDENRNFSARALKRRQAYKKYFMGTCADLSEDIVTKGETNNTLIESSLSGLTAYIQSSNVAFITAFKSSRWHKEYAKKHAEEHIKELDFVLDGDANFSRIVKKLNRERNNCLLANLKAYGFTIFKIDGSYENQGRKSAGLFNFVDKEESFAVVDTHHNPDFVKIISELGNKYDQESILIIYAGGNRSEFIYDDGSRVDAGKPTFGKDAAYKSLINGRPLVMESCEKLEYQLKTQKQYNDCKNAKLGEGYEDLISYMATGNKKKLSKKRKNQKKALSFFGNAGNPKYNADFFNHVMGSDGGEFGFVNGTDMVAGDMSLSIGGNAGGGDSAGGTASSGGGMGESLFLKGHSRTVLESFEIHKELNSLFFNVETGKMKEEVRHRLFKIAYLLIESMIENDIPLSISDILLIGSNAAYNYTEYSDLDLHILVDKSVVEDQELLTNLYNYIKADFNNKYDISIYGHDVEVYLQGLDEENAAAGVYSILKDEWVKFPEQPEEERSITIEDKEIFKNWENRYNNLLDHEIDTFVQDLYKLRKSSLKSEGEFSDGNLVFKEFRNRGYLKDLKDRKNKIKSNELTLEGVMTESSMSRIYKKLTDESSCAIISTYRSERTDAENLKLLQELKQEVKSKYGFIEFISRWSEATDEGVIASDERSLLIPNIELSEAMRLAKQYDQASFIYKDRDGCREICSNKFTSWDGVTYTPGDIVRYFNTKRDDKTILNLEDAREIFAKRKGGPASYLVKGGGQKAFHLDEVLEIENARPSYFQKQPTYIKIY